MKNDRIFNFSAGPSMLPDEVLEREDVQLLDITNTSDDLENMYTRIYGE